MLAQLEAFAVGKTAKRRLKGCNLIKGKPGKGGRSFGLSPGETVARPSEISIDSGSPFSWMRREKTRSRAGSVVAGDEAQARASLE